MYKTLPNEDEEQKKSRLQKENREKKLYETNPYITPESLRISVETSTAIEGVHVDLKIPEKIETNYPKISEEEHISVRKRGRPRKE